MDRPPPWKCRTCRERKVVPIETDYTAEMEHDGRAYQVTVKNLRILECENCHARTLPDEAEAKLAEALRYQAGLLMPSQIRESREKLGLSQAVLAEYLRVAPETVNRWEKGGQIQQRAMDLLLRAFFDLPSFRHYLGMRSPSETGDLVTNANTPTGPVEPVPGHS